MSDSLEGLGDFEIFSFDPGWETEPSQKRSILVTSNIYDGTIHSLDFYRNSQKNFKFTITDEEAFLYELLIFFADKFGRQKKFWFPDPFSLFTIKEIILDDFQRIRIEKLRDIQLQGHEILYIQLNNNDIITRKIESFSHGDDFTEFIVSPLTEFSVADIKKCSLIYLGRFNQDAIEINYDTDKAASCDIEFIELLEEYPS